MLVSFSGIDSAGKSTQIDMLCRYCDRKGIGYRKVWSKARGTPGVLFIKELVRKDKNMNSKEKAEYRENVFNNPRKRNLLYIASMLDLCWYWGIYYRLLNLKNRLVICDRYLWDTYVEIKEKEFKDIDIDQSFLWRMVKFFAPTPHKSFVFVIPAEESLRRDHQKNAAGIEDLDTKEKKIACYMQCVQNGCWTDVMNGLETIDDLHKKVLDTIGI